MSLVLKRKNIKLDGERLEIRQIELLEKERKREHRERQREHEERQREHEKYVAEPNQSYDH